MEYRCYEMQMLTQLLPTEKDCREMRQPFCFVVFDCPFEEPVFEGSTFGELVFVISSCIVVSVQEMM